MTFRCEDLARYGVVLIPPDSPEYDSLVEDIQRCIDNPVAGGPPLADAERDRIEPESRETSAILVNRAGQPVALTAMVWDFEHFDFEHFKGTHSTRSFLGHHASTVLLPFGLSGEQIRILGYWHFILPGSKRYLCPGGTIGDNSDVRPPGPGEVWRGGVIRWGGVAHSRTPDVRHASLTLDGVFFADGSFAGPNTKGMWEGITAAAEQHLKVAELAREAHERGVPPTQILSSVAELTGPPRALRHLAEAAPREMALHRIADRIDFCRKARGDDETVRILMEWAGAPVPKFRRLT